MTGDVSRLIGWHLQRPGDAWFPASWSFAISVELDFGWIFDSIICLVFCQAAQAEADKQTGRCWRRQYLFSLGFLPKIMSCTGLWIQKAFQPFSWVLDATKMEPHRVGLFEELETDLFRNHIVVDAVI